MPIKACLMVWCADGMAMGDVCGTNTSFSKAVNPCNTCEDFDQRDKAKRKPCSVLACLCGDADRHAPACPCHFRLRTPARDLAKPPNTAAERRAQGLRPGVTPGLKDIPGYNLAQPGPKDTMHTLNEGRTSQLAAVTCWRIAYEGLATPEQLQRRAATFDWTPGASTGPGRFRPNYLPDKIFVKTKLEQPGRGSFLWGPHKDIDIPGSAAGVTTFTIMSNEFFRPFISTLDPVPSWYRMWLEHRAGFLMTLRFRLTYGEILIMEKHFIQSEDLVTADPRYANLWIPKAHWTLHLAHDTFLYGPLRLLTTLLNEMKNARFKAGAKRGNFHNPVKDVALFWARQSDYELSTLSVSSSACEAAEQAVLICGRASSFTDSTAARLLLEHSIVGPTSQLDFLSCVKFHGVPMNRTDYVLFDDAVYNISRLVRANSQYYMLLLEVAPSLCVDEYDSYFVSDVMPTDPASRFVHLCNTCAMTCFWCIPVPPESRLYLVPKF